MRTLIVAGWPIVRRIIPRGEASGDIFWRAAKLTSGGRFRDRALYRTDGRTSSLHLVGTGDVGERRGRLVGIIIEATASSLRVGVHFVRFQNKSIGEKSEV